MNVRRLQLDVDKAVQRPDLLPLALGIADGIVNALILASSAVLRGSGLTIGLALRVAAVALVTSVFTVFVAEYGQLRAELARAERQQCELPGWCAGHCGRRSAPPLDHRDDDDGPSSGGGGDGPRHHLGDSPGSEFYSWCSGAVAVLRRTVVDPADVTPIPGRAGMPNGRWVLLPGSGKDPR